MRSKSGAYEEEVRGIGGAYVMMQQIALDYAGAGDIRAMDLYEIRFWYEGLRPSLMR